MLPAVASLFHVKNCKAGASRLISTMRDVIKFIFRPSWNGGLCLAQEQKSTFCFRYRISRILGEPCTTSETKFPFSSKFSPRFPPCGNNTTHALILEWHHRTTWMRHISHPGNYYLCFFLCEVNDIYPFNLMTFIYLLCANGKRPAHPC